MPLTGFVIAMVTSTVQTSSAAAGSPIVFDGLEARASPVPTSTASPPVTPARSSFRIAFRGQVFARARATRGEGGDWAKRYALTRARISTTLHYEHILRATIEPDFAGAACAAAGALCDGADLSDVYLEVIPLEELALRVGQSKTPYGVFETTSAWRLPTQRRGLVSEIVTDRLGFGGRKLGARVRAELDGAPFEPSAELGVYPDVQNANDEDVAIRLGMKPLKRTRIELASYARAHAAADDGYGFVSALALRYEKKRAFGAVEGAVGRARLLRIDGADTDRDATFVAVRLLLAYSLPLGEARTLELEPYVGFDAFDPNARTRDDLGGALRVGANFYYVRMLRISLEYERREGRKAFVSPEATLLSLFVGVSVG